MVAKEKVRYKTLLDSIEAPVVALQKDLLVLYCNDAYAQLAGKKRTELEGKNLIALFPEGIDTPAYLTYMEVLETGQPKVIEQKTGSRFYLERIYPTPVGIISIADDISIGKRSEAAVKAFKTNQRAIFDESYDAIIVHDVQSNIIVDVNKTACEMFGYRREEMLKLNIGDLCAGEPPHVRENLLLWFKRSSEIRPQNMEMKFRDKSGRVLWVEIKSKRMLFGDEVRLLAIIREITRGKYAEKALRDSQERYEQLFEKAGDFIFIHDLMGNFISVNRAAERVTGYWSDELLKMNIAQLASSNYTALIRGMSYRKMSRNETITYELEIVTKFDDHAYLEVVIWPIYKAGKIFAIQGIARDISERKINEKELRNSEQKLDSFIDFLPDATMAIDLEGKVVVWNQAMEKLTGIQADDMLGKADYEYGLAFYNSRRPIMVDLVLRPEEVKKYYSVIEKDEFTVISEFDTPHLRGAGHYLWGQAMPWYDKDGKLMGAIESLRDITQRYKSEQDNKMRLEESVKQFAHLKALLSRVECFCCSYDPQGNITFVSAKVAKVLGYSEDELVAQNIVEIIADEYQGIISAAIKDNFPAGEYRELSISFACRDGSEISAKITLSAVWENGEISGGIMQAESIQA
ncbi:MAG: PAS domain S-box protein [Syntrophomonadaceae bacterium]|nr:PAS domain S-box protein [Syntrophomonadaceae bacterium]